MAVINNFLLSVSNWKGVSMMSDTVIALKWVFPDKKNEKNAFF